MATGQTDFREYLRGETPPDWTSQWEASTTWLVRGMPYDAAHRNLLRRRMFDGSTGGKAALTWNVASGNDQEILVNYRAVADQLSPLGALRVSGASSTESAYLFGWDTGTTWRIWKLVSGTLTSLASGTGPAMRAGRWLWIRFQVSGTTVRGRVWEEGDVWPSAAGEEPTSWTISTTDSALSTGAMGVAATTVKVDFDVDYFAFGTGGDAPPEKSTIRRPMATWSKDPTVMVDVLVEVEGASRTTGTVTKEWYLRDGDRPPATDYPANVDVQPLVKSIAIPAQSLSADSFFSGSSGSQDARITFKNEQARFDDVQDRTYSGRRIVVRVGEKGAPLRTFEPVWSGLIKAEPTVSPSECVFETSAGFSRPRSGKAAASSWLDTEMRVGRNVGIPTCLENLTVGAVRATTATNTAWDVTSLTLMMRMNMAANPATLANPIYRSVSGTNQWVTVVYNTAYPSDAGKFAVQVALGGGGAVEIHKSQRLDDALWHDVIWSIRDKSTSYLMIDGVVVSEYTPASSMGTASGVGLSCFVNWLAKVCDVRLYGYYLEPDEASALFAQRADPDDRCVGMWRCDDGLGPTMVDVSSGAKNMTIAGTENTDYRWKQSYLGDAELAGQPMPFVDGEVFNAEAPIIDQARGIARFADQEPDLTSHTVRLRGYPVAETTDYTDDLGYLDFVDAPAEPVTVSVAPAAYALRFLGEMTQAAIEGRVDDADETRLSTESFEALDSAIPWFGGARFEEPPKIADYLKRILEPCGAHFGLDPWGRVAPGYLLPTINPGPYGIEPLLEFTGSPAGGIALCPDLAAALTGSFTIACWWKSWAPDFALIETGVPGTGWGTYPGAMLGTTYGTAASNYNGFAFGLIGDQGRWGVDCGLSLDAASTVGVFRHSTWHLTALVYNASTNTSELWNGSLGDAAMVKVAERASLSTFQPSTSEPLFVGGSPVLDPYTDHLFGFCGSICYLQVYSAAKTGTDFTAILTGTRPTTALSNLVELFPMNEGEGDEVQGAVNVGGNGLRDYRGKILGARWCPRVTLNITDTDAARVRTRRALKPAWRVEARWKKNHRPLDGADLADVASAADKSAMRSKFRSAMRVNDQRAIYPDSREIVLDTCLSRERDAIRCAGFIADRFAPGCEAFDLAAIRRETLALNLTDEILVYDARHAPSGRALRVITLQQALDQLRGDIAGWGV